MTKENSPIANEGKIFFPEYGNAVTIHVPSWSTFFDLLQGMKYGVWCYRGHESSSWELKSGKDRVLRKWKDRYEKTQSRCNDSGVTLLTDFDFRAYKNKDAVGSDLEWAEIQAFRSLTEGRFGRSFTKLDYLGAMQHYGTHTRLLDFSFSPYVAAFFAFENEENFSERAVYAINLGRMSEHSSAMRDARRVVDLNPEEEPSELWKSLENEFDGQHPTLLEVYRRIAELSIGRESDVSSFRCEDIVPVVIEGVNNRLVAQDGLFLLPLTFDKSFDEVLASLLKTTAQGVNNPVAAKESDLSSLERIIANVTLVRFVFAKGMNDSARQVLNQANLSDRVVYPDLEGIAKSINSIRYASC